MGDVASARELIAAAAKEVRSLADQTTGAVRKRLLVLGYVTAMAERELLGDATGGSPGDRQLVTAIRAGDQDGDLLALVGRLRGDVRSRLTVSHPGYDRPAGSPK